MHQMVRIQRPGVLGHTRLRLAHLPVDTDASPGVAEVVGQFWLDGGGALRDEGVWCVSVNVSVGGGGRGGWLRMLAEALPERREFREGVEPLRLCLWLRYLVRRARIACQHLPVFRHQPGYPRIEQTASFAAIAGRALRHRLDKAKADGVCTVCAVVAPAVEQGKGIERAVVMHGVSWSRHRLRPRQIPSALARFPRAGSSPGFPLWHSTRPAAASRMPPRRSKPGGGPLRSARG